MNIHINYYKLIAIENLFQAWNEFRKGKRKKADVQIFERYLEDNLFNLHQALADKSYRHGDYKSFYVFDPKQRHIHKAPVQDRIVHHLLSKFLYELFDKTFICDSYSCRLGKGIHRGVTRLENFTRVISKNYTRPCWVFKCDIKKFFASVDHEILLRLLENKIKDRNILYLLGQIIESFHSELGKNKGIPLGNLTSQIFANIYLNELDQFVKHKLKIKYYLRYADDFLVLGQDKRYLEQLVETLKEFLKENSKLQLHPQKVIFRKLGWGIDFLGYIVLPRYRLPRTKTKRRIFEKLKEKINSPSFEQSFQSYLGYLSHANTYKLTQELKNQIWFWYRCSRKDLDSCQFML